MHHQHYQRRRFHKPTQGEHHSSKRASQLAHSHHITWRLGETVGRTHVSLATTAQPCASSDAMDDQASLEMSAAYGKLSPRFLTRPGQRPVLTSPALPTCSLCPQISCSSSSSSARQAQASLACCTTSSTTSVRTSSSCDTFHCHALTKDVILTLLEFCHSQGPVSAYYRRRVFEPPHQDRKQERQAPALGHRRPGALPIRHKELLSRRGRCAPRLRHHKVRTLRLLYLVRIMHILTPFPNLSPIPHLQTIHV